MLQLALRPLATLADTPPATGRTADTNDWDTVFALPFDRVNPAIATNWTAIEAKPDPINDNSTGYNITYTLDITFGPWQVALGGDGKNIDFTCPVTSGTYTVQLNDPDLVGKPKTYPFPTNPNSQIAIEVGMQWIPDPAEPYVGLSGSDVPTIRTALTGDQIPSQLVTDLQPHKITLSSSATVAAIDPSQPSLAWKITDGANAYYLFYKTDKEDNEYIFVYQFGKAWAGNLTVLSEQLGANSPPVTIRGIVNNPVPTKEKANAAMLESILSAWFNDNLDVFNHVFATLNISAELDTNDKWQWLTPTGTSYAVVDGGTISQSVFGVLTMTGGRPALSNHEISPNAIPADGSGSDTGFLISGPLFLEKIMLPGAMVIFDSTNTSDFIISNDGLSVTNTKDLTWGPFITSDSPTNNVGVAVGGDLDTVITNLDNNSTAGAVQVHFSTTFTPYLSDVLKIPKDSPVTVKVKGSEWFVVDSSNANNQFALKLEGDPGNQTVNIYSATQLHIPAKQFSMSLNHAQIDVSFVNLNYAYSSDFNVNINYNESWTLGLKEVNGRKIFWYTDVFNKGLVISVTKTQTAITREIVEGAIAGVLALIAIAGPIIEGLSAGAEVGELTEEGGTAVIDSETFADAEEANPAQNETDEAEAGSEAANQAGGKWSRIKAAFKTPKWKAMGAIAGIAGAAAALDTLVDAIIESAANNEWENVPTFDAFANLCIAPYTFPDVKGFTLNSAQLADSLQIGLKVNS